MALRRQTRSVQTPTSSAAPAASAAAAGSRPAAPGPTKEEIAREAYYLWQKRGGKHGDDWKDWLEAERILRERYRR